MSISCGKSGDGPEQCRILILDDETSILEILGQHLSDEPYECVLTTSPLEAVDLLSKEPFSLLMTDLKMPEMHGIEVVQKAKALNKDLAVIVVTALMDVTHAVDALRVGADDYLLKPFNLTEISLSVEKALERRKLYMENRAYHEKLEMRVKEATQELEGTNQELRATKEYLENLLHSTEDGIFTLDRDNRISFVNSGGSSMVGFEKDELLHTPIKALLVGGTEELNYIKRILNERPTIKNYETELIKKNGEHTPVNISLSMVGGVDGKVISTFAICKDITEQKRLEEELKEMSIKDSLTGLYNQRYFHDRLAVEIERAKRQGHPLSMLLFDVDDFKTYNDCHGHLDGDNVLATAGKVIFESTRDFVDIGFRYGGDEFTVILPEADEDQAYVVAERIRTGFEACKFDDLTLSLGLMQYKEGVNARSFMRITDSLMYEAKRSGGNRVYVLRGEGQDATEVKAAPEEKEDTA